MWQVFNRGIGFGGTVKAFQDIDPVGTLVDESDGATARSVREYSFIPH
jgi:hypothetical protein